MVETRRFSPATHSAHFFLNINRFDKAEAAISLIGTVGTSFRSWCLKLREVADQWILKNFFHWAEAQKL